MSFSQPTPPSSFGGNFGGPPQDLAVEEPVKPDKKRRKSSGSTAAQKQIGGKQLKIALALAGVAALGAVSLFSSAGEPVEYVAVAKDSANVGTVLVPGTHLVADQVPVDSAQEGAFVADTEEALTKLLAQDVDGAKLRFPLNKGQVLSKDALSVEKGLAANLGPDEALLSISASVGNAVAGQIGAGDKVDILATAGDVSGVVLNNVEVVSYTVSESQYQSVASQQTGENKGTRASDLLPGAPVPGIYVVRIPASSVPTLTAVNAGGSLTLVYRGENAKKMDTVALTAAEAICGTDSNSKGCN